MKKSILYLFLVIIVLSVSCKKGLDRTNFGVLSPLNFPKTESEFDAYASVVYKPFNSKWGYNDPNFVYLFHGIEYSNVQINDATSDYMAKFPEWGGFWTNFGNADFVFLNNAGTNSHFQKTRFITRITKIIDDVQKSTISDSKKTQLIAEARMSRGWLMYYLLTMFGPVPVILDAAKVGTDAEADLTRPARADYVKAILDDLRFAADNLVKSPAEYGRFNKGIALGVLMRTHLFEKNYQQAESVGRELIALGGYSLIPNYRDLFRAATEKNNETIWAVSVDPAGDGTEQKGNFNAWGFYIYPSDYPGNLTTGPRRGGYQNPAPLTPTWAFYDSFDPADRRRELLIPTYAAVNSGGNPNGVTKTRANMRGPVLAKYPDDDPTAFMGNDIPVLRYADVLLMMAEAINGQNGPNTEAIGFVNQVRNRSNIGNLSPADIASKQAFADAILRERGWELYMEGFRRVDLMRFGKWNEYLVAAGKTPNPAGANGYFPIPQYVMTAGAGKITQNAGY